MTNAELRFLDKKPVRLHNLNCPYCGREETPDRPFNEDHVIGRKFVPKGSFAKGWVLKLNACEECNSEKGKLENDISAITLHSWRSDENRDPAIAALAKRKAHGSRHPVTKKRIAESFEKHTLSGPFGTGTISIGFLSPPQLVTARVHKLAGMHLQAFTFLTTYDASTKRGQFIWGEVGFLAEVSRSFWGNRQIRAFADLTRSWDTRVCGGGADGYFMIAIRRAPIAAPVSSFALEWNRSLRIIGFFGDLSAAQPYIDGLPEPDWKRFDSVTRYQNQTLIDPAEDFLFAPGPETEREDAA